MEVEKRKLIKFSNYSLCVTLPKWVIKTLDWKKGDYVNLEINADSGKIVISGKKSDSAKPVKKSETNLRW